MLLRASCCIIFETRFSYLAAEKWRACWISFNSLNKTLSNFLSSCPLSGYGLLSLKYKKLSLSHETITKIMRYIFLKQFSIFLYVTEFFSIEFAYLKKTFSFQYPEKANNEESNQYISVIFRCKTLKKVIILSPTWSCIWSERGKFDRKRTPKWHMRARIFLILPQFKNFWCSW